MVRFSDFFTRLSVRFFVFGVLAVSLLFSSTAFAAPLPMRLSALDTVAGYETTLSLSGVSNFAAVQFYVTDPLGRTTSYATRADFAGDSSVRLSASSLSLSGTYRVATTTTAAGSLFPPTRSPSVLFQVYPDTKGEEYVTIHTSKDVVRTQGSDFSLVTVSLTDRFGNPFVRHAVSIRALRSSDIVRPYAPVRAVTDDHGVMQFAITSRFDGQGLFAVSDETTGRALQSFSLTFTSAVFLSSSRFDLGVGGESSTVPPTQLAFENLTSPLPVNQPLDFTVTAYDGAKSPSGVYRGTVHFTATGDNAVFVNLPKDYTFSEADLGRHIFPLALQFTQEGSFTLKVEDAQKSSLNGTVTVTVKGGNAKASTGEITMTQPSPGSYASSAQTIEGMAPAGKDVKIYDSNEEIGTTTAHVDGKYTYVTKPLADGPHELTTVSVDSKGAILATSAKVKIVIDTQPPSLLDIDLQPGWQVQPNTPVQIRFHSEAHLKKSQVDIGGQLADVQENPSEDGLYTGSFASPNPGQYPVKVILADALSNETSITADKKLTVRGGPNKPVRDVLAAADSYKVSVSWTEPEDAFDIQKYRIYYGTDYKNFSTFLETNGPVTSFTVPNLENNVQYYFGIVAVDSKGVLGEGGTLGVATPKELGAIGGLPSAPQISKDKKVRGNTGPEVLWLLPLSGALTLAIRRMRKK